MDETLFITALLNLEIVDEGLVDLEVMPGVNITNDSQLINNCIGHNLAQAIGVLEVETLQKSKAAIYGVVPANSYPNLKQEQFLAAYLMFVEVFLRATWLIRDNSINFEMAFVETPFRTRKSTVSSNFLASVHTNAQGGIEVSRFTAAELVEAIDLQEKVAALNLERLHTLSNFLQKGNPRVARTFHFLEAARYERNPAFKIAHYCTCFETLFSTSSSELSHKLAERMACFMGGSADDKYSTYQEIKAAYNVRSKVVHGDVLSNDQIERLEGVSRNCDHHLRAILRKILNNKDLNAVFDQQSDALEDYLVKLALGSDVNSGE